MKTRCNNLVMCVTGLLAMQCYSSYAGSPEIEAGRCTRWLSAFIAKDLDKAARISVEQLKQDEVPDVFINEQRTELNGLYDKIEKIGGSSPKFVRTQDDHIVEGTGDIIKSQIWSFQNGSAYVGCVSYPGTDDPWHLVVKFDDNSPNLIKSLEGAARSHVSSPPTR